MLRFGENLFCKSTIIDEFIRFSTGWMAGAVISRVNNESTCWNELGPQGFLCCCISLPITCFGPCGGMPFFICLSCLVRERVKAKYNVEEEDHCGHNDYLNCLHIHCNYPCSFFQMYMSIREWDSLVSNPTGVK